MPTTQRDLSSRLTSGGLSNSLSLLDTVSFSQDDCLRLFAKADSLSELETATGRFQEKPSRRRVLAFVFFEPSTRTRMSFQMAAERLGYKVNPLEVAQSSLSKGESLVDTVLNVVAMKPDGLIIRYGHDLELGTLLPKLSLPVISAGTGMIAHPTQALLDAYTIQKQMAGVKGRRVLIVGDVRHSRVARSNFDILLKLGAEIGICGPREFMPAEPRANIRVFTSLDEACEWCDVYMGLRVQLERHQGRVDLTDYTNRYGLNKARLDILKQEAIILHPGPINYGTEFVPEVAHDPRNRVLDQVSNGVLIRGAVLARTFEGGR